MMENIWIEEPDIHSIKAVVKRLLPGEVARAMTWE